MMRALFVMLCLWASARADVPPTPAFGLHIPVNAAPGQKLPLLVWLAGGEGSRDVSEAVDLVDFDEYAVAVMPYPEGKLPRLAIEDGTIGGHLDFLETQLDQLFEAVPNIDRTRCLLGGTSSGAHVVGSALDLDRTAISDRFTGFIIHEGGYCPQMLFAGAKDRRVLVIFGEQSRHLRWQKQLNEAIANSGAQVDFIAREFSGHTLRSGDRQAIRGWIEANNLPR